MGNEVKYHNVTFNDTQNGAKKTFQVEQGTTIQLTNSAFTVNKDCTIDVTLPQYTAASVWDSNHDGKINRQDTRNWRDLRNDDENFWGHDDIDTTLSRSLAKAGASYGIVCCGGGTECYVDENGFHASFENMNWVERDENPELAEKIYDRKEFGIYFPEK